MGKREERYEEALNTAELLSPSNTVEQAEAAKHLKDHYRLTRKEIGQVLNLTERQVMTRLVEWKNYAAKGLIPTGKIPIKSDEDPLQSVILDEEGRRERLQASREAKQIVNAAIFEDKLAEALARLSPQKQDLSFIEKVHKSYKAAASKKASEEVVLATKSDLHLCLDSDGNSLQAQLTANDHYNETVLRLTDLHRRNFAVKTIVLNYLGDMVQGTSNFPNQSWSVDRPAVDQAEVFVSLMVRDIELALAEYDFVRVLVSRGNHGAVTPRKTSPEPETTNWETIAGRTIRWMFRDSKRVSVEVPEDWYSIETILGNNFLLTHGHAMTGSGSFDTLVATIRKYQAILEPFDYALCGHYHRLCRLPLPRVHGSLKQRCLYVNGTAVHSDEFIAKMGGSPTPQWWCHFVGPKRLTAEYAVDLYA